MAQTGSYRINCNFCGQRAGISSIEGRSTVECLSCDQSDELGVALQAATRNTLHHDLHDSLMKMLARNPDKPALYPALTDVLPERASRWAVAYSSSQGPSDPTAMDDPQMYAATMLSLSVNPPSPIGASSEGT